MERWHQMFASLQTKDDNKIITSNLSSYVQKMISTETLDTKLPQPASLLCIMKHGMYRHGLEPEITAIVHHKLTQRSEFVGIRHNWTEGRRLRSERRSLNKQRNKNKATEKNKRGKCRCHTCHTVWFHVHRKGLSGSTDSKSSSEVTPDDSSSHEYQWTYLTWSWVSTRSGKA